MKKFALFILIFASIGVVGYKFYESRTTNHQARDLAQQYQCPMHPQVIQSHPGNCPICGMHLVKVEGKEGASKPGDALPVSDVAGHRSVRMEAEKARLIGIKTEVVRDEQLLLPLRLTGSVFYNPQILNLLNQYREAAQVQQRYKRPTAELVSQSRATLWNLRNQLRRLGVSEEAFNQIKEGLEDPTQFVPSNVSFQASGAYVDARVPVSHLAYVRLGQKAEIHSLMAPEKKLEGVLRSLDSVVDSVTQTLAVRFEVVLGYELLKPGMFVTVDMELDLGSSLSIPSTALFNPGKQAYVFVERSPGVFVPQSIQQGLLAEDRVQVLGGVQAGDKVVTAANFLLDSESRFQAARADTSKTSPEGGHSHG